MKHRIIVETTATILEDTGARDFGDAQTTRAWVRKAREVYGEEFNGRRVRIQVRSAAFVASWDPA